MAGIRVPLLKLKIAISLGHSCRYAATVISPSWAVIERSAVDDGLIGSVECLLPVVHPCVSRPHSKHSRYRRSGVRRIQSSWPMKQHFNDSRRLLFHRNVTCVIWVHIAPATAARTVVFSNREPTSRGLPYLTKQITPTVLSTMTPRHVSKWSSQQSGERSRPRSM